MKRGLRRGNLLLEFPQKCHIHIRFRIELISNQELKYQRKGRSEAFPGLLGVALRKVPDRSKEEFDPGSEGRKTCAAIKLFFIERESRSAGDSVTAGRPDPTT
ncbi:adenosine monophosphate-protein transferase FICD [Striga asiatica]|uniref:Adenosine monophosphate-protein transferase FICD n=1 Tax=Striga asiatica TaxID=4170 RepID=A0A5A7PB48_STRAF|nr:adenosine monophosphate-protein transferase FICD [Striga asiatica]